MLAGHSRRERDGTSGRRRARSHRDGRPRRSSRSHTVYTRKRRRCRAGRISLRWERARNARLLPRREHTQTIAGASTPGRRCPFPPPACAPRPAPVELKFMKNDRRLSPVARKENPHCPRDEAARRSPGHEGKMKTKETKEEEAEGKNKPGQAPWGTEHGPRAEEVRDAPI